MATKHVVVGHPGKLSAEQLARIQDDYERDLAVNRAAENQADRKPSKAKKAEGDKGDDTEK